MHALAIPAILAECRRNKTKVRPENMIPKPDALFAAWLTNFSTLLTAAPATYGLTAPDAVIVAGVTATWDAAYLAATEPSTRTSVTVADKNAARAAAEAVIRPYSVQISLDASVTNGDKTAIGVTVRSTVPTPIPAPVDAPSLSFVSAIPLVTSLQAKVAGSTGKAKPAGCIGIEIYRSVGAVAAVDPAQLGYVGTATKTPFVQNFGAGDQGKVCTIAARYVTRSGPGGVSQSGPWSALLSFVVL